MRIDGFRRIALALIAEGAALVAKGLLMVAKALVDVAERARSNARREECSRCLTGDMTARRSCATRTSNTAKCGAWAGAGGDA